jgi:hypothetical protein
MLRTACWPYVCWRALTPALRKHLPCSLHPEANLPELSTVASAPAPDGKSTTAKLQSLLEWISNIASELPSRDAPPTDSAPPAQSAPLSQEQSSSARAGPSTSTTLDESIATASIRLFQALADNMARQVPAIRSASDDSPTSSDESAKAWSRQLAELMALVRAAFPLKNENMLHFLAFKSIVHPLRELLHAVPSSSVPDEPARLLLAACADWLACYCINFDHFELGTQVCQAGLLLCPQDPACPQRLKLRLDLISTHLERLDVPRASLLLEDLLDDLQKCAIEKAAGSILASSVVASPAARTPPAAAHCILGSHCILGHCFQVVRLNMLGHWMEGGSVAVLQDASVGRRRRLCAHGSGTSSASAKAHAAR